MFLRVAVTLLIASTTLGVDVREIDTLDFAYVNASVLIDAYVSRGVPVKLRHEDPTLGSWITALEPAGGGARGWRSRPTTAHIAAVEAMQLFPMDETDAIHLSIPKTIYGGMTGYRQTSHVDELCNPSYALGISGSKRWTFQYDGRDEGVEVIVKSAAFEEDDIFDLFSSSRQYTTTLLPGELLIYAVWMPHAIEVLQDLTETLHGTLAWKELEDAQSSGRPSASLPPRVGANCARRQQRRSEAQNRKGREEL